MRPVLEELADLVGRKLAYRWLEESDQRQRAKGGKRKVEIAIIRPERIRVNTTRLEDPKT